MGCLLLPIVWFILVPACRQEPVPPARRPKPRNLVLLSLDTTRPDRLGCFGSPAFTTANIDRLASNGVMFADATAVAPLTGPSHAALLTGLLPTETGVLSNGFALRSSVLPLATILKRHGFGTAAAISGYPLSHRFGFARGFDQFDDRLHPPPGGGGGVERRAEATAAAAIRFLGRAKAPFFLFVHLYDPHAPYDPPYPFSSLSPYDGEISYADQAIGRILAIVRQRGLWGTTAICLVSDHGEGLSAHQELRHGVFVYQSTIQAALIVHVPRPRMKTKVPNEIEMSRIVPDPVSLMDVFPTLLELVGIETPPGLAGRSLIPAIAGETLPARDIYFESRFGAIEYGWAMLRGIRRGPWKLIEGQSVELYRLDADPGETQAVHSEEGVRTKLQASVDAMGGTREDVAAALTDADVRARLAELGYLGGGPASGRMGSQVRAPDPRKMVPVLQAMRRGEEAFQEQCFQESADAYMHAIGGDPENTILWFRLAKSWERLSRLGAADEVLKRVFHAAMGTFRAEVLTERARISTRLGNGSEAMTLARAALLIDPNSVAAMTALAEGLAKAGRLDEAVKAFGAFADARARSLPVALAYGQFLLRARRTEAASKVFRRLLGRSSDEMAARLGLARCLLRLGDGPGSVSAFRQALPLPDERPELEREYAQALLLAGDGDEAVRLLGEQVKHHPSDLESSYTLAYIESRLGRNNEALAILGRLAREMPNDPRVFNTMGVIRVKQGRRRLAVGAFSKAVELDPDRMDYRENLKRCRE